MSDTVVELDTTEWDGLLEKMTSNLAKAQAILRMAAQAFAFQDIIQHFADESGPDGRWPDWSPATQAIYAQRGWGGNKLLQATGKLRQSLLPGQGKITEEGRDAVRLFSNVEYSALHNYGGPFLAWGKYPARMPQREFMWLSDDVQDKIVSTVAQLILEGA